MELTHQSFHLGVSKILTSRLHSSRAIPSLPCGEHGGAIGIYASRLLEFTTHVFVLLQASAASLLNLFRMHPCRVDLQIGLSLRTNLLKISSALLWKNQKLLIIAQESSLPNAGRQKPRDSPRSRAASSLGDFRNDRRGSLNKRFPCCETFAGERSR